MIKRIFCLIIVSALALTVTACKGSKTDNVPKDYSNTSSEKVGIVNPMVLSSADEIAEKFGFIYTVPDGYIAENYYIINGITAQINMTSSNMEKLTLRMKKEEKLSDISGMYYNWTQKSSAIINGCKAEVKRYYGSELTVDVCNWYDEASKTLYSISVSGKNLDGFDISAVAWQINKACY